MSELVLNADLREKTGKSYRRKLKKIGKVPGVFYAQKEKSVPVEFDENELVKLLLAEPGLIDIKIGDKRKRKAIIKEIQTDPIKQFVMHVDIMGVKLKEKITVSVPVRIVGEAIGVKEQGGILHQYLHEIEVNCLPLDIPENVEVDVSELEMGDSISISDIITENFTFVGDIEQPVVSILAPSIAKEKVEEEELEEELAEEAIEGEEEAEGEAEESAEEKSE